ncbi:MAG: M14 family zinc carboxypeptidase, partial [Fidelibacterota bacterium]
MLALTALATGFLTGQEISNLVRVYYSDFSDLQRVVEAGIALDHVRMKKGVFVDVVATPGQMERLRRDGFRVDMIKEDLTRFFQSRFDRRLRRHRGFQLGSMGGNYTYDEMVAVLDSLHAHYPSIVSEKRSIGLSLQGRDVWAVKVSDNPEIDEGSGGEGEPQVLYTGLTHAREPMGMMNLIYFITFLCERYGSNGRITQLVDSREMWFVPCVNPDGYVYNETIHPGGGGMHRKNRRDTGCGEGYARGVDLNRNYGYDWGADNIGSSPDSCAGTFRGDSAFSEPETSMLRNFMMENNFQNVLHYHAYSNLLIHSFGDGSYPPEPDLSMLREYGAEMTRFNRYRVGTGTETVGYTVNGDAADYSYGTLGLVSYIPEVGSFDDFFWPATERIVPLSKDNVYSNFFFAWIAGPALTVADVSRDLRFANPGDTVTFTFAVRNAGLLPTRGPVTAGVASLNTLMDLSPEQADLGTIEARTAVEYPNPVTGVIDPEVAPGCPAGVVVRLSDSDTQVRWDTLSLTVGTPELLLAEDGESGLQQWDPVPAAGGWGLSSMAHGGDYSITDSPGGNYSRESTTFLTLKKPLDLTGPVDPRLDFWARWEIETGWDYAQIQAT